MKNLIVTVNGVAYNVTVEEGTGAPVAAACSITVCPCNSFRRSFSSRVVNTFIGLPSF